MPRWLTTPTPPSRGPLKPGMFPGHPEAVAAPHQCARRPLPLAVHLQRERLRPRPPRGAEGVDDLLDPRPQIQGPRRAHSRHRRPDRR
jgi:hypothetical protein